MNKIFWVTFFITLVCFQAKAQEMGRDTSLRSPSSTLTDESYRLINFSCEIKNRNTVGLYWKADKIGEGDFFIVERSYDGIHFETVGILKITDTSTQYGLLDNSPLNGTDFYRIKYSGKQGNIGYSKMLQVNLSADVDFKFYPNPADKLLIIRTGHNISIQILDVAGLVRINKEFQPGLQVINVSSLEKGSYVLKIADKESNRVVSEQLFKN